MNPPKEERNKMIVLAIKAGQRTSEVARSLGMAKSTVSHIWNRDKDKYGPKKYKSPEPIIRRS